ncbi:glycerol-3-phosphate cytidylyltransferase [uncultured Rhodoblastus sp.]|uniref:glycerol-3-phosphate cytidylyltransferase n=1 Tax=uncultured Rhodoblastus sp. TaxID=543037 RepID=UPI0025FFD360|nr:glycerol-3-phosphate cytidylyltransferase [uncultured Rhodoblastus sp.]
MTTVITYGTFDLFHRGHLRLLERARQIGDRLVVGVSTDNFNAIKGKKCVYGYDDRSGIVGALKCVDEVFPEDNWEQKQADIVKFGVDVFVMGDDWEGKFDFLKSECDVRYLSRTEGVSTTQLKGLVKVLSPERIAEMELALNTAYQIISSL